MLIEEKLKAFRFGQLQDCVTILKILERNGLDPGDLVRWVDEEKKRRVEIRADMEKRRKKFEAQIPRCPDCKTPMVLRPAGESPEDGSHWTCPKCRFGRYDPRPVEEIIDL